MKKQFLLLSLLGILSFALQSQNNGPVSVRQIENDAKAEKLLKAFDEITQSTDQQLIEKTVNYYLEGGTNNDFDTLKKAFHKDATMKFVGNEGYKEVNALEFFGKAIKPGPKSNRKTYVSQINISGTAASARLEIIYPDAIIVDYMNLLKIDGEWKIVSKIFHRRAFKKLFPKD